MICVSKNVIVVIFVITEYQSESFAFCGIMWWYLVVEVAPCFRNIQQIVQV